MNSNKTTFWSFLTDYSVEIPIIQRDYAQGREGKESLRNSFLTHLKQALDCQMPDEETELKLDFVYGSLEQKRLNPLDGQQRLTTLWLLHWYIALKAGKLADAQDTLGRFGYETRLSSREFCNQLCHQDNFKNYAGESAADYIEKQTWFYRCWKQDPTIQSMLRMIRGTKKRDKKDRDITDGLEEIFAATSREEFTEYWAKLTSSEAPIVFYHLPLHEFGLSDDLYVKMNARGKQLSSFENFKADFIGYIEQEAKEDEDGKWKKFLDPKTGIPLRLDTTWADIFWSERYSKGIRRKDEMGQEVVKYSHKTDELFFAFFNRFFWNELFIAQNKGGKYVLDIGKGDENSTEENNNPNYYYLNDAAHPRDYDLRIAYDGFDSYKYIHEGDTASIPNEFFEKLDRVLTRYREFSTGRDMDKLFRCPWNSSFFFIPRYVEEKENGNNVEIINNRQEHILRFTTLSPQERIVFFAICKYFDEGEADELSLRRWMRVTWNLISGEDESGREELRTTSHLRSAIKSIGSLDSHRAYESLSEKTDIQNNKNPSALDFRLQEEKEKAQKILNDDTGEWENRITEAEKYSFCKGTIGYLYHNADGRPDWSLFDGKQEVFRRYFREKSEKGESALREDNATLLKCLISRLTPDQFEKVLYYNHHSFNNYPRTWKYYLQHNLLALPVHELLTNEPAADMTDSDEWRKHCLWQLSKTGLLDYIIVNLPTSWIRWGYHNHLAIFPSAPGVFLNASQRDRILLYTEGIEINDDVIVGNREFLYGNDIDFRFEGKRYRWKDKDHIVCLADTAPHDELPNHVKIRSNMTTDEITASIRDTLSIQQTAPES